MLGELTQKRIQQGHGWRLAWLGTTLGVWKVRWALLEAEPLVPAVRNLGMWSCHYVWRGR